jgi:hypothetical protein
MKEHGTPTRQPQMLEDESGRANCCRWFDVSTLFGRDISKFPDFIEAWYGDKLSTGQVPKVRQLSL